MSRPGFFPCPTSLEVRPDGPDTKPKQIEFKQIDTFHADPLTHVLFMLNELFPTCG